MREDAEPSYDGHDRRVEESRPRVIVATPHPPPGPPRSVHDSAKAVDRIRSTSQRVGPGEARPSVEPPMKPGQHEDIDEDHPLVHAGDDPTLIPHEADLHRKQEQQRDQKVREPRNGTEEEPGDSLRLPTDQKLDEWKAHKTLTTVPSHVVVCCHVGEGG